MLPVKEGRCRLALPLLSDSVVEIHLVDRDALGRYAECPDLEVVGVLAVAQHDPAVQATRLGRAGGPVHATGERGGDREAVASGVARLHAARDGGVLLAGGVVVGASDRGVPPAAFL